MGQKIQAEETARKLDTDVFSLRQRVQQLEGMVKSRDREVERVEAQAEVKDKN